MDQLFAERAVPTRGLIALPEFTYLRNGLRGNLAKLINFYRTNPRSLPASHLLVRILQSLAVSHRHDILPFTDLASDRSDELAMSLGLTSPLHPGRLWEKGVFYGEHVSEILISATTEFDPLEVSKRWEEVEPIQVLSHPYTDLNLDLANGQKRNDVSGLAVVAVNIPLLALQYKLWRAREATYNAEHQRTLMHFLCMYPLANMLRSHLDVAFFNRLRAHFGMGAVTESALRPPLHTVRYEVQADRYQANLLLQLLRRRMSLDDLMVSTALITKENLLKGARLPQVPPTRQVLWALTVARLDIVGFLVQLAAESGSQQNQQVFNRLRRHLLRLKGDQAFRQALGGESYRQVLRQIEFDILAYI